MSVVEGLAFLLGFLHHNDAVLTKRHTTHSVPRLNTDVTSDPALLR